MPVLDTLLGWFSQDLAMDLGSDRTRVHLRGAGVVLDLASAVALRTRRSGTREVVAVGDDALAMLGRTPTGLAVVRPIRSGRVVEGAVSLALIDHIFTVIHGKRGLGRPRVLFAEAPDTPTRSHRAIRDCLLEGGARSLQVVPRPLAAALGAGLDPYGPLAHMVVDVGAGTTSIGVIAQGSVLSCATLDVGGDVLDGAILRYLRNQHRLLIGSATAEALKREISVTSDHDERTVAGRCLERGVPRACTLPMSEVREVLQEPLQAIAIGIRRVLEQADPRHIDDIVHHGAFLCGGQAQLPQLDVDLRDATGVAMLALDTPDQVAIQGAGMVLEDTSLMREFTQPA